MRGIGSLAALAALCAAACDGLTPARTAVGEVESLRVEPAEIALEAGAGDPANTQFKAIATFADGQEGELDLVNWDLSNASIGTIDSRGRFASVDSNGGTSTVTATHLNVEATATITLVYRANILESGVEESVAGALAEAEPVEGGSIDIEYPFAGSQIPRNVAGLWIQWTGMSEGQVARVRFTSALSDVSAYTTDSAWEVPTDVWEAITATNSDGEVQLTVTVADVEGDGVQNAQVTATRTITVDRLDTVGSVTYWSMYDGKIMRVKAGETEALDFYPMEGVTDGCWGCHAISEKRQWMVVTTEGLAGKYRVVDIADPDAIETIWEIDSDKSMTFRTLSPDGNWMLGVSVGELKLYDLPSNELVETPKLDGSYYANPDWSPAGDQVVAIRLDKPGQFRDDTSHPGGDVVLIPWDGASLGMPEVLVPEEDRTTQYYPAWSPDGRYIVFNRSTGDSQANPDAELWLVDALGGEPIRLDNANGAGDLQNSMAKWAPLPDGDMLWLAYSTKREYPVDASDSSQIWITAIDPDRMDAGEDPSFPPYWMPGQRTDSDNHLPLWWSR